MTAAQQTVDDKAAIAHAARLLDGHNDAEAEAVLNEILVHRPQQPQALQLLGFLRMEQRRTDESESLFRRSLAIDPDQPLTHYNLGRLLHGLGRHEFAVDAFRAAIRLRTNFAAAHLGLALALSDLGNHAAAEKSCRDALRFQPNYLLARQALAAELCFLGRAAEAETLLRRTLALGIRDPHQGAALEHALAMALKQQEKFSEALTLFDAAQSKAPDLPAVDINRGNTLQQLGRLPEAARAFARAVAREPDNSEANAGLALMSALTNDFTTARSAADRALQRAPGHPIAQIALAIAEIEAGDLEGATQRLRRVVDDPAFERDSSASFALGFAADALERGRHYSRAFDVYATSNRARRRIHARFEDARVMRDVERLMAFVESCERWPASDPLPKGQEAPQGHVFVLGYMRSGTTLLQTVLSTNPNVVSIDEIEFLTAPAREFMLSSEGLARLMALGPDEAASWRDSYWKSVRSSGLSVAGKIFVDKMPFNSLRLPLIARLFPEARVVFAIRDPRDVVLSCFRRRFNPTTFSYEFLDLADCARFYASTMALSEWYRQKLPIIIRDHRYEDMVADFDTVIRGVCDFTGIHWDPSMREFAHVASTIDRRSPSATQVERGLYRAGVGQWRHYREQLRPVQPILEPWVARFGYSPD